MILFLAKSDKFHGEMFSGMFNSCTINSMQLNLNLKTQKLKVNCLNFKKFFQRCISLLEMISILVIGCHPNFEQIEFKLSVTTTQRETQTFKMLSIYIKIA